MHRLRFFITGLLLVASTTLLADIQPKLTSALQPGQHFLIIRHAIAPGIGDPANFDVTDCSTQRNLSKDGRQQAASIGRLLSTIQTDYKIYSSQWCRCMDTARELSLGEVNEQPLLNSFFRSGDPGDQQTKALKRWITSQAWQQIPVLVTHQVNITGLTGVYPQSGEVIVAEFAENGFNVIERVLTDN